MAKEAAQLPEVVFEPPKSVLGKNTQECLKSGFFWGYVDMVTGLIERMKGAMLPESNVLVIGTGGWAKSIFPHIKNMDHLAPNLTLLGLHWIYQNNKKS